MRIRRGPATVMRSGFSRRTPARMRHRAREGEPGKARPEASSQETSPSGALFPHLRGEVRGAFRTALAFVGISSFFRAVEESRHEHRSIRPPCRRRPTSCCGGHRMPWRRRHHHGLPCRSRCRPGTGQPAGTGGHRQPATGTRMGRRRPYDHPLRRRTGTGRHRIRGRCAAPAFGRGAGPWRLVRRHHLALPAGRRVGLRAGPDRRGARERARRSLRLRLAHHRQRGAHRDRAGAGLRALRLRRGERGHPDLHPARQRPSPGKPVIPGRELRHPALAGRALGRNELALLRLLRREK